LRSAASQEEIAFAKNLDVHQLDSSLPPQRLEDWLKSGSLKLDGVDWHAGGCNITEGHDGAVPKPEGGLCAWIWFRRGNASGGFKVWAPGIHGAGPSKADHISVVDKDHIDLEFGDEPDSGSSRLSELPRLLDEQSVMDVTRNLYDAVVALHPLGVPHSLDRAKIFPLLSRGLRDKLESAHGCGQDFVQHLPAAAKSKPEAISAGIFSGEGDLAMPGAALVDHKELQADGSFLVLVWLSHKHTAAPNSVAVWKNWHVLVTVKLEDHKFLVNDVRLFDGISSEGPSELLSESFAACAGSR
jgi:hypothetical protein